MNRFFVSFLLSILPLVAQSEEQHISLEGHWHLNVAKSFNPYRSDTTTGTLIVRTDDGRIFESAEEVIRKDGTTNKFSMRQPVDGKFYPVAGGASGVMAAVTERTPGMVKIELRAGSLRATEVCHRLADTLTCTQVDTDSTGKQTFGKAVYDRLSQSN